MGGSRQQQSRRVIYGFGTGLMGVALLLVLVGPIVGWGSAVKQPVQPITGVSLFAIFYLMAQVVERAVEPFSNSEKLFAKTQKVTPSGDESLQWKRTAMLWCFASALGIILCYFTLGLFQMVSVTFTWGGHSLDALLSGVIIGSGTKPLHDLIGFIQGSNP